MNKLLKKLHANKVTMKIIPINVYDINIVQIKFERPLQHKIVQISVKELSALTINVEDILIKELDAFLKECGLEVSDESL